MFLSEAIKILDSFAPPLLTKFDYAGFLVGGEEKEVKRVGITLDPTLQTIQEAANKHCDLLITHHGPDEKTFNLASSLDQKRIQLAMDNYLPIYRMHLNLDFCAQGNSETLTKLLGFSHVAAQPIRYKEYSLSPVGMHIATGVFTLDDLIARVKKLNPNSLRVVPSSKKVFKTVAVAPGQGFIPEFLEQIPNVDAYISGEINHVAIVRAIDLDICLIEATHAATENEPLKIIAKQLTTLLSLPVIYLESEDRLQVIPLF